MSKYAIFRHGGKQYRVSEGEYLKLDHFSAEAKSSVEITDILCVKGNFHKPFYKLSGGMKQKMLIAIAFAKDTEAMMFDEPTANLDPKARRNFMDLLGEFAREKTLVFISHRLDEVQSMSNRYVEMDLGRIIKDEPIAQGGDRE